MVRFLPADTDVTAALTGSYDGVLVLISYLVACLASYAGLLMSDRLRVAESPRIFWTWLGAGALSMGIGVWAMHFVGMLAFVLPVAVSYDVELTVISAIPAVLASALALHIMASQRRDRWAYILAGSLIGAGIGTMHYAGMAAMRVDATMYYETSLFVLSIVIAAVLGIAALFVHDLGQRLPVAVSGGRVHPIGAALIGLAITGMHYTAMQATYFLPAADLKATNGAVIDIDSLGFAVVAVTTLIVAAAIVATLVDRRLRSAAQLLRATRQRMMDAIDSISDGFILFDGGGELVLCNRVFRGMYPDLAEALRPPTTYERVLRAWADRRTSELDGLDGEAYIAECLRRFKEGTATVEDNEEEQLPDGRWVYIRQRSVESGGLVGVWADITPVKELQNLYEELALRDPLTGLANRKCFEDRLLHAAAHARRQGDRVALIFVDLDRFKPINDQFGHDGGDLVLKTVAARLLAVTRDSDTAARLGGDEFAVILEPGGDRAKVELAAQRVLAALKAPMEIDGKTCGISASVGVAIGSPQDFDHVAFLRQADEAMYEVKKAGGGAYLVYDEL